MSFQSLGGILDSSSNNHQSTASITKPYVTMKNTTNSSSSDDFSKKIIDSTIKIGLLLLLLASCFNIVRPFIGILVWGMIIAVALYPLFQRLSVTLGGRKKLTSTLITIVLILIIIGPCVFLAEMISQNSLELMKNIQNGSLSIPEPSDNIVRWPLIGQPLFDFWQLAATNLSDAINTLAPQLKKASKWLLFSGVSTMVTIIQLLLSVIISGMLLINGENSHDLTLSIFNRLIGDKAKEYTELCITTIRSVARGVLGVAFIQAFFAGIGFFVAGVPGAGILTILCLLIAIVQLPTIILLLPTVVYVFSTHSTLFSTIFMIWMAIVGLIDNVLKPILLGRDIDIPMAVIFIGAIGGMMFSGIIGLFIGAILLALAYKLFLSWLHD